MKYERYDPSKLDRNQFFTSAPGTIIGGVLMGGILGPTGALCGLFIGLLVSLSNAYKRGDESD